MCRSFRRRCATKTIVIGLVAMMACQGGSDQNVVPPPPPGSFTLSLVTASIAITQGSSGTVAVNVTRNNAFAGAVNVSLEGAPAGVAGTFDPASIPAGSVASSLTLSVASSAVAGTYTLTIRGQGQGVSDNTVTLTLTIAPAGGFSLSLNPPTVTVQQGASNSTLAQIERTGGFTGAVTLSVTGSPAGMTAIPATTIAAGSTVPIIVTATTVAVGTYQLILHGTAAGLAERTANFAVEVTPAQNSVAFQFCGADLPVWVAAQSDGGGWTQLGSSNGGYSFSIGSRGGIAVTQMFDGGLETTVVYGTAGQLRELGQSTVSICANPATGSKNLMGSVSGLDLSTRIATVSMGSAFTIVGGSGTQSFSLAGVPNGLTDLAAVRLGETDIGFNVDKLIMRRGINPPGGSTLALLDFLSAESFEPIVGMASVLGVSGDMVEITGSLMTANHTTVPLYDAMSRNSAYGVYGLPPDQLASGDLYQLFLVAQAPAAVNSGRGVVSYFHTLANQTIPLGPAMATPTVQSISTSGPQRFEVAVGRQDVYGSVLAVSFSQSQGTSYGDVERDLSLYVTADYLGGAPTSWDVTIPDLSSAGYQANFGLLPGAPTSWAVMATSARSLVPLLGQPIAETSNFSFGIQTSGSASTALNRSLAVKRLLPRRRF